jgi:putative tryptophan/tyrosine transport system substrate-binding protein
VPHCKSSFPASRREFITFLGSAAAVWPVAAGAQQPSMPVIGFLNGASSWEFARMVAAFHEGLSAAGYIEGRNVAIEYRWAEGHYERLPTLAADLIRRPVTVLAVNGPAAPVAKAATTTIPVVFTIAGDPVELGLVVSLNRPGSNLTGVSNLNVELWPKRLELMHEMVPTATTIAVLINPTGTSYEGQLRDMQKAAQTLGLNLHILRASAERDFDTAFAMLRQLRLGGLVIATDAFFNSRSEQLAELTVRNAVPTIYQDRTFAAAGGLMSYGASLTESYRLVGTYAGRILKGEKPADLPVQQATKVELIINMKTAMALGLTFPLTLLGRADEVIE